VFPFERSLDFPDKSFFLFGPRGVGKSSLLRRKMPPTSKSIDLLEFELSLELTRNPGKLEAICGNLKKGEWIWVDEVQKVPALLDEVQRLIETRGWKFALSGSSARKLRRGGANLLAGRALTKNLEGFTSHEMGKNFDLRFSLEFGTLPLVVTDQKNKIDTLSAYVHTYLREEIKEEGLVRKIDPFLRFLEIAGQVNGEQINSSNIARDAKISRSNVDNYFSILEDTLLGHWLRAYHAKAKVKEQSHPKFYWFDPGVARAAGGLLRENVESTWLGKSLETFIFHELRVYNHTSGKERGIFFYKVEHDTEIDFIIETKKGTMNHPPELILIEVKFAKKWDRRFEKPMLSLASSGKVNIKHMYGLYLGKEKYYYENTSILPVEDFLKNLHGGLIF
jgi:predicted AAA+ superfamily ATPase